MRRIGLIAKRLDFKNILRKDELSTRSRHFVIGLIVLGVGAFVLLHGIFNVVHQSSDRYREILSINAKINADPFISDRSLCWNENDKWAVTVKALTCKDKFYDNNSNSNNNNTSVGIRSDPRILYSSAFKASCTIDCNDSPGIDAGTCIRESESSSKPNKLGQSQSIPNSKTSVRCLPSFIIAGAMKSGTGELMKWLDRHPYLKAGKGKIIENDKIIETNEIHYFGEAYTKATCKWLSYLQYFPNFGVGETLESSIKEIYTFEKSPDYMRSEEKIKQMKNLLPNLRLLIILRNPVTRAISAFDHNCRHNRYVRLMIDITYDHFDEKISENKEIILKRNTIINTDLLPFSLDEKFGSAVYETIKYPCDAVSLHEYYFGERIESGISNDTNSIKNNVITSSLEELSYGFYDIQLSWILKYFPKEHIKVMFQENMYNNTFHTLREVELFLKIPCYDFTSIAIFPQGNAPPIRKPETYTDRIGQIATSFQSWNKDTISSSQLLQKNAYPETKAKLKALFRTHVTKLITILDKNFSIKDIPQEYL